MTCDPYVNIEIYKNSQTPADLISMTSEQLKTENAFMVNLFEWQKNIIHDTMQSIIMQTQDYQAWCIYIIRGAGKTMVTAILVEAYSAFYGNSKYISELKTWMPYKTCARSHC
jgi:hypothetical protein